MWAGVMDYEGNFLWRLKFPQLYSCLEGPDDIDTISTAMGGGYLISTTNFYLGIVGFNPPDSYSSNIYRIGSDGTYTSVVDPDHPGAAPKSTLLYPNPATDRVTVVAIGSSEREVRWTVNDLLGRTYSLPQERSSKDTYTLTVQSLPAGMYYVRGIDSAQSYQESFVKE